MEAKNWSLPTKILHIGLVATVSLQLVISLLMDEPDEKGSVIGGALFEAHEVIGLSALAIVILHWTWSVVNQVDGGLRHLFPWGRAGREQIGNDIKALLSFKFPPASTGGGLAGLIHGLGLLAVTGIALSGGMLFLLYPDNAEPEMLVKGIEELHEGFATLVWTYWLGHGGIAILHHLSGHDYLKNMFTFGNKKKPENMVMKKNIVDVQK